MTVPIVTANKKSLLVMVQNACDELGLKAPTSIINNSDAQIKQFLALANREGKEYYMRAHRLGGWQELRNEYIFTVTGVGTYTGTFTNAATTITGLSSVVGIVPGFTVFGAGIATSTKVVSVGSSSVVIDTATTLAGAGVGLTFGQETYTLPNDWGWAMTKTWWDRTMRWQLLGPLDAQEWQVLKSGISPAGPRRRFRIMGNLIYINPIPGSAATQVVEYYSTAWCQSAAAVSQNKWVADTDYYNLDDEAFIMGMKWRFKAAKGLDYQEEQIDYEKRVELLMARNGANRDLPLNAQAYQLRLLSNANVPDTGFGS